MKRLIILLLFVMSSCYVDDTIAYIPTDSNLTEFESELLYEINTYRHSIDLIELKTDTLTQSVARKHCQYMIDKDEISHDGFHKRMVFLRDYGVDKVGENVGYGFKSAEGFLYGYLNSVAHKSIIEREYYTHIGVVVLKNEYDRNYNVLIFVNFE